MSGVLVTGHVRSGTSMVAGLFAHHGVFFGDCGGPTRYGPKGHFENRWLKTEVDSRPREMTQDEWTDRLKREGWDKETPWGAKLMPMHWWKVRSLAPTVVVCCYRDRPSILASAKRMGWKRSEETVREMWKIMDGIRGEASVVSVYTPDLVRGYYEIVTPAFAALGLTFDPAVANEWIDPELWHYR